MPTSPEPAGFLERLFPTFFKALGVHPDTANSSTSNIVPVPAALKGFNFTQSGNSAWDAGLAPGSLNNYGLAAGDLWKNSTVFACLNWARRTFPEAPLAVGQIGTDKLDHLHPMARLIRRPNPAYGRYTLWAATVLSYMVDGNCYWFKVRSGAGDVTQLWYRPHWLVKPVRSPKGGFVDYYAYTVNGQTQKIPPAEVVHLRNGIDPENELRGLSDLAALLRTVVTDNQATNFCASMLRNMGMPGPLLTPKQGTPSPTREQATAIKQGFMARTTGDNVGMPVVIDGEYDVTYPEITLDGAALLNIRKLTQSDIAAAIGLPAVVVGLLVGLETGTAKASYEDSRRQAFQSWVIPVQASIAEDIDIQLLPDFETGGNLETVFDYSQIASLSEQASDVSDRWGKLYQAGVCTRGEARAKVGLESRGDDDVFAVQRGETIVGPNDQMIPGSPNDPNVIALAKSKPAGSLNGALNGNGRH